MTVGFRRLSGAVWLSAIVLIAGCALTLLLARKTEEAARELSASQFAGLASRLSLVAKDRLVLPSYGLGGLRSVVAALDQVPSVAEFRNAVLARDLPREFPGVYGYGLIERIKADRLSDFVARTRADYAGAFAITTKGTPEHLYVIRSIEPLQRNRQALGFDVGSDPVRREAIELAMRTRSLALTGPLSLRQGGTDELGSLYLLPAYAAAGDADRSSPPPLLAIVYAAVSFQRVLAPLSQAEDLLDFSVTDITAAAPVRVYPYRLASDRANTSHAGFRHDVEFSIGGRRLVFSAVSMPAFDALARQQASRVREVWFFGLLASCLLATLAWLLLRGRQRAVDLARSMTVELDRLAMVARLTHDAVTILDARHQILWVNRAFAEMTGRSSDALRGCDWLSLLGPAQTTSTNHTLLVQALAKGASFRGELDLRDPAGRALCMDSEVQPLAAAGGRPGGFIVVLSDVTERRALEQTLRDSQAYLKRVKMIAGVGGWQFDLRTQELTWSEQTRRIHEVPENYRPHYANAIEFYPPVAREQIQAAVTAAIDTGRGWDLELPFVTYRKRLIWVRSMGAAELEGEKTVRLTGAFQDISRRKFAEIALEENRELLRVTLNSIGDAVVTTDAFGVVTWLNPIAETLTGWATNVAKGRHVSEILSLVSEETRHSVTNPILMALKEKKIVGLALNTVLISRDGTEYGVEDSAAPIQDAFGRIIGAVMVFHDVTEARALNREISHQAHHDALTGLPNRLAFETNLGRFLQRIESSAEVGAVMIVDLDHFKIVNDTCGHHAGDELLCQIAALLKSCVRSHDTVARLGGDEFALLLENCSRHNAERVAQNICDAADRFRYIAATGQAFRVGTSIGVLPIEGAGLDHDHILQAADTSCYIAKESGRNRFHTWQVRDESVHARIGESAWGARIEKALDERSFRLYAQRIQALSPGAIAQETGLHFEVLLRLIEADGTVVSPAVFIPVAERYQLATRIDRWVVQEVMDKLSDMADSGQLPSLVAINLSGQSISDRAFHEFIKGLIDRARFDVRVLCFEITETAAITKLADATTFLQAMRQRGIRIALDDFGAGVSSFGYLKNLTVDFLKIDGQFVRGVASNPLDLVSVRSFCEVARVLGIQTIAEYVEREELRVILQELGVDFAQGYLIHHPEPLANLFRVTAAS